MTTPAPADLIEPDDRRPCPACGTSWTAEIDACPQCQDATKPQQPIMPATITHHQLIAACEALGLDANYVRTFTISASPSEVVVTRFVTNEYGHRVFDADLGGMTLVEVRIPIADPVTQPPPTSKPCWNCEDTPGYCPTCGGTTSEAEQ